MKGKRTDITALVTLQRNNQSILISFKTRTTQQRCLKQSTPRASLAKSPSPLDQTEASEQQPSSAEDVAKRARDLGVRAITVHANVAEQSDINNLFATAKKESGRIDIVMSDSGIEHFANVESVTGEEFDKVIALNVKAQFFVAQTALTALKYLDDGGRVILISSISAVMGITVNAIAPGGVKTDMYEEAAKDYFPGGDKMTIEEIDERISGWSPLGRPIFLDDVAGVVALLSNPESQWLTGQNVPC